MNICSIAVLAAALCVSTYSASAADKATVDSLFDGYEKTAAQCTKASECAVKKTKITVGQSTFDAFEVSIPGGNTTVFRSAGTRWNGEAWDGPCYCNNCVIENPVVYCWVQ